MTPPLAPFAAERYLLDLRDRTAGAPPDTPRELAWLWACAALDVRSDNILIPVLVTPDDLPLLETLDRLNRDRGWQLPPDYFAARLARGGCLLILDSVAQIGRLYPRCPILP
jgi:hypothetical protein